MKNNGVPILSKAEIDAIGERFVQDFQPEVLTNPSPVDIEGFIEFYLGMTPDYQYLSHNGVYLMCTPNTGHPVLGVLLYEIQLRVQTDVR